MDTVKAEDCVIAARYAIDTIESFMIFALRFAVCVIVRKGRLWNNWERWCQWGVLFCGDEFVIDDDGRDSTRQIWNMRRRKKANVSKTTQQLWHHFSKTRFCDFLCLLLCSNLIAGHHFLTSGSQKKCADYKKLWRRIKIRSTIACTLWQCVTVKKETDFVAYYTCSLRFTYVQYIV